LTLVETVGYGDQINKEDSFKSIVDYIDTQFEYYLQEELKVKRLLSTYHDTRVHTCLYFICPTGHGYVVILTINLLLCLLSDLHYVKLIESVTQSLIYNIKL